jgi:A/G-specific adenine glycosylase
VVHLEQRRLLEWGESVRRDFPWRLTRDPWSVLVSEVMLQQTQAARVVDRYQVFIERWSTAAEFADADLSDVLVAWTGMGYPRRARNLHLAAAAIDAHHGGVVPDDLVALLALPGVGAYTARAVLAFAFEVDGVGVVDTNIARILARRSGRRLTLRQVQQQADDLVPTGRTWDHNQSLMDLGALVCRPTPACDRCPWSDSCRWHRAGHPSPDPAVGSAGVSGRQARFEGSDRQARGRLLRAAASGPLVEADLVAATGWIDEPARARLVTDTLVADGLLVQRNDRWALP